MAVELAKVSLWLDCFTLGAPLSFLDHHLKCGNSLIGAQVTPVREEIEMVTITSTKKMAENARAYKTKQVVDHQFQMFGSMWAGAMLATDLMRQVGELPDTTAEQVHQSRAEYQRATDALAPFKRILDVYTSRWFGNPDGKLNLPAIQFLRDEGNIPWLKDPQHNRPANLAGYPEIANTTLNAARGKRFFHWELEFPEVFFGPSKGSVHEIVMKDNPGFDAVVGNPPWVDVQDIPEEIKNYLRSKYTSAVGKCDLYALFVERGISLLKINGSFSMIIQSKFLVTEYGLGLRSSLAEKADLKLLVHFADAPIFGAITAYPLILVAQKKTKDKKDDVVVIQFPAKISSSDVEQIIGSESKLNTFASKVDDVKFRTSEAWQIDLPSFLSIEGRFKKFCVPFGDIGTISYGVKTNGDNFYLADLETWRKRGIEEKLLRPAIKPRDFDRYVLFDEHTFILFPYEDSENGLRLIELDSYPGAKRYLEAHKEALSIRRFYGKSITEQGMKYYELPYVSSYSRGSKLAFPTIAKRANFALDPSGEILFIAPCYVVHVNSDFDKAFLLSILNSKFIDVIIRARSTDLASGYMEMQRQYVEAVPIRRVSFNTTLESRKTLLNEAQSLITNGDSIALLKFVTVRLDSKPEESDVVQDLLAFLARRMVELNIEKQAEIKRFLSWLEGLLKIRVNDLTNKTRLKTYMGDHQKSEAELSYSELEDILYKNKGKLGISLSDGRVQNRLRAEYEGSLKVLRPVKAALAWTDGVIDQIVYRLYGLNDEEIAIIEGTSTPMQEAIQVQQVSTTGERPQTIARVSDPNEFAGILQALDRYGPLTTRQLADFLVDQRITLEPRKADTIRHEFIFLDWIEADQARWALTERGKDLAALGGDAFVGEFARQLCLDSEIHNQHIVSRLLLRMERLSPDLQGAIILPRPEMDELPDSLDDVRKLLRAGLPRWSKALQQQVKNFAGLANSDAIADRIVADIQSRWSKANDSERSNRLQERISEAFVELMFGQIMAANDVEIWQVRMDWAGLTHTARDLPGVQGQVWFPVGAFREKTDDFTPLVGLVNFPGDANALTYCRYTPAGADFEKQFMRILYEGYRQVQLAQHGNEYVSLLTVRDWVCYRLRISHEVFENTLQNQFPRALRGEIPYSLALEVDVMPSELMRLGNARPVSIDKQPRYIIAMRSHAR